MLFRSLSPLIGNILLHEFDSEMNKGDVSCLRYIDDFLILAPNIKAANAAFKRSKKLLEKHKMSVYSLTEDRDKAELGQTKNSFTFLGCDIRPGIIRPNKKSQTRLLNNIDRVFNKSLGLMGNPELLARKNRTVTDSLNDVSNIMREIGRAHV